MKSKGFGPKLKTRKRKKLNPRRSLKLERYMNKYFGDFWAEDCVFKVIDSPDKAILFLEVPIERHDFFTEERQQKLKQVAFSFGFNEIEIELINLKKDVLIQFSRTLKIKPT